MIGNPLSVHCSSCHLDGQSSAGQTGSEYIISLKSCPEFQSVSVMTDKEGNAKFDQVQINSKTSVAYLKFLPECLAWKVVWKSGENRFFPGFDFV